MSQPPYKKYLLAITISILIVATCLFIAHKLSKNVSVSQVNLSISTYIWFFSSVALIYLTSFFLWKQFSKLFKQPRTGQDAFIDTGLLAIGKYLPGKIWGIVARGAVHSDSINISRKQLSVSAFEQVITLASGIILVTLLLVITQSELTNTVRVPAFALLATICGVLVIAWRMIISKINFSDTPHFYLRLLALSLGYMLMWGLSALPLLILLNTEYQLSLLEMINAGSAFISAMICGWIVIFMPGGIGIREIVFSYLSPNSLTWQQGLFWITLHRALYTAFDLIYGSITLAIIANRRRTSNATN